jgi:hypothetical protein
LSEGGEKPGGKKKLKILSRICLFYHLILSEGGEKPGGKKKSLFFYKKKFFFAYNTESLLTLYDIFFPQSSQRIHRVHRVFKNPCVLCGLFFSVSSAGNKMREYFQ